jgi:hypothetical protein
MTRLVYTDLSLKFTATANTFPTSTQVANDITQMYKLAAEYMDVDYSATMPDTNYLFAVIKAHVESHENRLFDVNSPGYSGDKHVPPLLFTKAEIDEIAGADDSTQIWTVDSASKTEDID